MKQMVDKITARDVMKKNSIPVIPGSEHALFTKDEAIYYAQTVGYPVMLKASAGGGGIAMQIVHSNEELSKAFDNHSKRAKNFFTNVTMFIEKVIEYSLNFEI